MAGTETAARRVAGRYRLREPLGRGGMGVVWLAEDELLQRPVAVKEIHFPPHVDDDERERLRERTLREARAAARLDHPCAVRVFDVCEDDEQPFIVMELLAGRTLSAVVHEDGPLPPARVAAVGACILEALQAAHAAGIVHRDVKPGNVIVRDDGRVSLTDFGIASTAGDPSITSTGTLLGSPAYIAPERARGGPPEPASDLWSLGATLYCAVEGHPPFEAPDPFATLTAVATETHERPRRAGPALGAVLDRMLEKDPALRADPDEVRRGLLAVAADPAEQQAAAAPAQPPAGPVRTGGHTVALPMPPPVAARTRAAAMAVLCLAVFAVSAALAAFLSAG